jgi:hypothetical protein
VTSQALYGDRSPARSRSPVAASAPDSKRAVAMREPAKSTVDPHAGPSSCTNASSSRNPDLRTGSGPANPTRARFFCPANQAS